jgi:CRP/FNR family transcriptional regulator, dissimilatory nitrate respiration regulator
MDHSALARLPEATDCNAGIRASIESIPWLAGAGSNALDALEQRAHVLNLNAREWVFRQGSPARALYLVIKGSVRLVRTTRDGYLATIRCAWPGEVLDELCLFSDSRRYTYSAEALGKSLFLVIPFDTCRGVLESNPGCMAEFAGTITSDFNESIEAIATLTRTDAMSRLAAFLLHRLSPIHSNGPHREYLEIPKCWLAAQLAMKPETLSRLLARLRVAGIVGVHGRRLTILNQKGLEDLVLDFD